MEKINCLRCNFRHTDNGNCTAVGGFCTAVQAAYCPLLRKYLDTGLTPERCAEFARADAEGRYIIMRDAEQEGVARLRELAEADKDGRVVVLPCKVGDTVYTIVQVFGDDGVRPRIIEKKITGIGGNALNKVWMVNKGNKYEDRFSPSEFGRSVFLTREEAEKALAEMVGKKNGV